MGRRQGRWRSPLPFLALMPIPLVAVATGSASVISSWPGSPVAWSACHDIRRCPSCNAGRTRCYFLAGAIRKRPSGNRHLPFGVFCTGDLVGWLAERC